MGVCIKESVLALCLHTLILEYMLMNGYLLNYVMTFPTVTVLYLSSRYLQVHPFN